MTYRLQMQGEGKRLERERQAQLSDVWHTAALPRMSPLPTFAEFTGIKPVVRKLTPAEMKARFAGMRETLAART
ncbi:MAG TPA: hypothetical protein VN018_09245 [Brevundimonas sp.]|nr:hypothetical protein [Brevundimonas sp.]